MANNDRVDYQSRLDSLVKERLTLNDSSMNIKELVQHENAFNRRIVDIIIRMHNDNYILHVERKGE